MTPPPDPRRLVTARLILEPIRLAVAAAVLAGTDSGLRFGRGWPHDDTCPALQLDLATGDEARTGWFVTLGDTCEVIGECGWRGGPDPAGDAEIGYGLAAPYRGFRYGTEAVAAMVGWCVRQPGVRRLVARVLPGNTPSCRLLEGLGFTRDGRDAEYDRFVLPVPPAAPLP